jgi:Zn-dependent protease
MPFFNPIAILAILIAISVHEAAHAWAAKKLGDRTAEDAGRLTLNPLSHIDPIGAILFLVVGFGWAKPVPVNPWNFKNPRRDNALVALAGPMSNLILGFIAFAILAIVRSVHPQSLGGLLMMDGGGSIGMQFVVVFLTRFIFVNLGLMAFNLLPIAPLGGSKLIEPFIPPRYDDQFEQWTRNGPYILLGVLVLESLFHVPILSTWVFGIANAVLTVFTAMFGVVGM